MTNCIYDKKVRVRFFVQGDRGGYLYDDKRTTVCKKAIGCYQCGWNPEVEERRKYNGLVKRHGYVDENGLVADRENEYWTMKP